MLTIDPGHFDPARVGPETARFNAELETRLAGLPPTHEVPVEVTRQARLEGRGVFPPGGPLPGSDWRAIPGGRAVRLSPAPGTPRGIYLHIHGGGWALGSPILYDRQNQELAAGAGVTVASARYRLAPEHRWPAHLEDTLAALEWVLAEWPGLPVIVGGESAGAHLAASTLLALRDRGGLARIAGTVLNYGMYDLRLTASARKWGRLQLILSTPTLEWFVGMAVPDPAARADPQVSPLLAGLDGMPPALFQIGTADPLLDDTLMMAARWAGAGRPAELAVYPGGVHAFDMFDLAIARAFRARQAGFVRGCL
jgi:acetyl esterase/lipase